MKVQTAGLSGILRIDAEPVQDERGYFARTFCTRELKAHGIEYDFVQHGVAHNEVGGTLRGLHYAALPDEEAKIVQCTRGAIFDVVVDLRPDSAQYGRWEGFVLQSPLQSLYIPPGFAHGYQTLEDDTDVAYLLSAFYDARAARGIRYDDPDVGIDWPLQVTRISGRDRDLPPLRQA